MFDRELIDEAMRRALTLARRGPADNRNPQVGCVIIDPEGRIVAEGWHRGAGTPHAEVDALNHLAAECRSRMSQLTAVVTLEPCNHLGQTGPCAEALAGAGIGAVAYALEDPNPVAGGGAETLRGAGVSVLGGVLAIEAGKMLAPWLARHDKEGRDRDTGGGSGSGSGSGGRGDTGGGAATRPYVTIKWAQSLDGRAAAADGSSQWITGPEARADVHRRRAEADAILVGTGTLLSDDPALTARDPDGGLLVPATEQPVPVVFGRRAIPPTARIAGHPAGPPLQYLGDDLAAHLADLHDRGIRRLFVEGGPTLESALIRAELVDELLVYVAPTLLGGPKLALDNLGVTDITGTLRLETTSIERLGDDLRIIARPAAAHIGATHSTAAHNTNTHNTSIHTPEEP